MLFGDRFQPAIVLADALGERAYLCSKTGARAAKSASGMCSAALLWKFTVGHLGSLAPKDLTSPRTWLTSCVRLLTSASRDRIRAMWAWLSSPRCLSGYNSLGSTPRARRARFPRRRSHPICACLSRCASASLHWPPRPRGHTPRVPCSSKASGCPTRWLCA